MVGIPHCTPGTSSWLIAPWLSSTPVSALSTAGTPERPLHSGARGPPPSLVSLPGVRWHRTGPAQHRDAALGPPYRRTGTDISAPGTPSGVWGSEECRLRRQHSLMLESASTSGTGVLSHRHLYQGDFIGRPLSVAERPHTRLRPGRLGLLLRSPLENGAAWRFPAPLSSSATLRAAVNCAATV